MYLEARLHAARRIIPPYPFDETVGRDDPPMVEDQNGHGRPLLGAAQFNTPRPRLDSERAQKLNALADRHQTRVARRAVVRRQPSRLEETSSVCSSERLAGARMVKHWSVDPHQRQGPIEAGWERLLSCSAWMSGSERVRSGYASSGMAELPTGTVTFLFTDIEGSTRLWEQHQAEMQTALERHDKILRSAIESTAATCSQRPGTRSRLRSVVPAMRSAAAGAAQRALGADAWPAATPVRVRMGVHTGEAQERDGDYFGPALNRAARLMSAGHGGQILVSAATAWLVDAVELVDLGEHRLKDLSATERVFQVGAERSRRWDAEVVRHNLPVQRTPLIGRRRRSWPRSSISLVRTGW